MLARQTYAPACLLVGWGGAYNVAALDGLGFPERARRTLAVLTMNWGPGEAWDGMMGTGSTRQGTHVFPGFLSQANHHAFGSERVSKAMTDV